MENGRWTDADKFLREASRAEDKRLNETRGELSAEQVKRLMQPDVYSRTGNHNGKQRKIRTADPDVQYLP